MQVLIMNNKPFMVIGLLTIFTFLAITSKVYEPKEKFFGKDEESTPLNIQQENKKPIQKNPEFQKGYKDAQNGKWIGPLRWTLDQNYRLGHMLGNNDRNKGINRLENKKDNVVTQ